MNDAIRISKYVKGLQYGSSLTFVGHSLGGGLASANARATGNPAITFNAMGLNNKTKEILKKPAKIDAYVITGEILDNGQRLAGLVAEGTIHYIAAKNKIMSFNQFVRLGKTGEAMAVRAIAYDSYRLSIMVDRHMMKHFLNR